MGSIDDQRPLFYEEPHPLTEPETEKLLIIATEKRSFFQRNSGKFYKLIFFTIYVHELLVITLDIYISVLL